MAKPHRLEVNIRPWFQAPGLLLVNMSQLSILRVERGGERAAVVGRLPDGADVTLVQGLTNDEANEWMMRASAILNDSGSGAFFIGVSFPIE